VSAVGSHAALHGALHMTDCKGVREPNLSMKVLREVYILFAFVIVHLNGFDLHGYATSEAVFIDAVDQISKEARQLSDKITDEWRKADVEWVHVDPRPLLMDVGNQLKAYRKQEICGTLCVATLLTDALEVAGVMVGYQCQTFNLFTFWVLGFLTLRFEQGMNFMDSLLVLGSMWSSVGYGNKAPPGENWGLKLWHGFHAWAGVLFVRPLADEWTKLFLTPLEGLIAQRSFQDFSPITVKTTEVNFCEHSETAGWIKWFQDHLPRVETKQTQILSCFNCKRDPSGERGTYQIKPNFDSRIERHGMLILGCESQVHYFSRYTVDYFNANSNSQQRRGAAVMVLLFNVAYFSVVYSSDIQLGLQRERVDDAQRLWRVLDQTNGIQGKQLVNRVLNASCRDYVTEDLTEEPDREAVLKQINSSDAWEAKKAGRKTCVRALWWAMPDPGNTKSVVDISASRREFLELVNESKWPADDKVVAQQIRRLYTPKWEEALADSFYMIMMTASTVGYGDVAPLTDTGKLISTIMMQYTSSAFKNFRKRSLSKTSEEKKPGDLVDDKDLKEVVATPFKPWYDRWAASCVDISKMPAAMRDFWKPVDPKQILNEFKREETQLLKAHQQVYQQMSPEGKRQLLYGVNWTQAGGQGNWRREYRKKFKKEKSPLLAAFSDKLLYNLREIPAVKQQAQALEEERKERTQKEIYQTDRLLQDMKELDKQRERTEARLGKADLALEKDLLSWNLGAEFNKE